MRVLGPVPSGLPPIALPLVSVDQALALLPAAIGIAVLSFADTALTGRNFAEPHGERTDPNRELVALSAADLGGSLTSGYPVSSSASRTQAPEAAGSQTQLAGIIAAGAVALVLLFLTGPLALLPIPALGAIVLAGALHFIKAGEIARIWRIQPSEGLVAIVAAACVVLYGTLVGVGVAALMAAFNVFRRAAKPHIAELGRLDGDDFADIERSPTARRTPGILIVRFAGPLFFATATALGDRIRELAASREPLSTVILDAYAVVDLDLTATDAIRTIERELAKTGTTLVIARPTGALRDRMRTLGLGHLAPAHGVRQSLADAVDAASDRSRRGRGPGGPRRRRLPRSRRSPRPRADRRPSPEHVPSSRGPAPWPPVGDRPETGRPRPGVGVVVIAALVVIAVTIAAIGLGERGAETPPAGEVVTPNLIGIPVDRARSVTEDAGLVLGQRPRTGRRTPTPRARSSARTRDRARRSPRGRASRRPSRRRARSSACRTSPGRRSPMPSSRSRRPACGSARRLAPSDPTVPDGAVIRTEPAAGDRVALGTSVALIVSSGPAGPAPTATPSQPPSNAPSAAPSPSATPAPSPAASPSDIPSASPSPAASPSPS